MAPGYRNANSRRSGRGHVDHDVYEGLPVRQWRKDTIHVAPPPTQDGLDNVEDKWDKELPWGMPKDSHLLPQHAQDLLRAARSGRIYKRSLPVEEEGDDGDGMVGDKPEKKEETNKDRGFTARAWKQIPRHLEGPDVEYLAKRRKGLHTPNQVAAVSTAIAMTRTTVRRTDAAGNVYQEVIVVPEGQPVDGEIVAQVLVVDPNAAAAGNTLAQPARIIGRKPGPMGPKAKRKGPGRGRKKKILAPTSVPGPSVTQPPIAQAVVGEQPHETKNSVEGLKTTIKTETNTNEDTEMGEDSQQASDDDGDDGEDGEEGEIIESDDEQDGSVDGHGEMSTPTPGAETKHPSSQGSKSVPGTAPAMKSLSLSHPFVSEELDARASPDFSTDKVVFFAVDKEEARIGSPLKVVQVVKDEKISPNAETLKQSVTVEQEQPQGTVSQQNPEPVSASLTTNELETPVSSVSVSISETTEIPVAEVAAPILSIEAEVQPPSPSEPDQPDEDPDEMLLDTIETSAIPPTESGVIGEEEEERQAEREESEFPDLMDSLERHLDGKR